MMGDHDVNTQPATVYWFHADDGELLYVGCTINVQHRIYNHRSRSPWFGDVAKITTAEFDTRAEALRVESAVILAQQPKHNKQHRSPVCAHARCNYAAAADDVYCFNHSDRAQLDRNDRRHGSVNAYQNFGCRCADCREAWRSYVAERRAKVAAA